MTFIKTISIKNTPANLTLKSNKAATSPASSISADKIADLDLITGSNFSAPGVNQKIINGAGLQDIGRADQIIGSIDRGSASVMDQVGLQAPSVQMPGRVGGGMLDALDPEGFIRAHDKTGRLEGASRGARMQGTCEQQSTSSNGDDYNFDNVGDAYIFELDEDGNVIGWEVDDVGDKKPGTEENLGAGPSSEEEQPGLLESIDGCQTKLEITMEASVVGVGGYIGATAGGTAGAAAGGVGAYPGGLLGTAVGSAAGVVVSEAICALDDVKEWVWDQILKNPNPEDDNAYGGTLKDPFGIVSDAQAKRLFPITKILDPAIDPNPESNTNGTYTGPSLGAVTGSNGGTSTGSWNNPYGFGGYSGPSVDAIALSNGGSSTGTFDPLF